MLAMLIITVHLVRKIFLSMFKTSCVLDFCDYSVPTPFPGFMVLIFLLMKKLPGGNIALYRLYIIPYEAYRVSQCFLYTRSSLFSDE